MQLEQCTLLPNTNARGATISNMQRGSVTECCTECQETDGCNVFVYCPKDGGCDDGSGRVYPQGLCTLKSQQLAPGEQPEYFATGPVVPWSSGYIPA
ncbi:hypothetical protein CHLNCDRAFT_143371 [Chlorella variabilis]|uniref:Apple domain-containing protein n=1 Tax=Chlorella variabilis TaxID=554065 RepID=E1Z7U0_CHLVA|nr:hypothetical protein CHLNCDRAFT_142122 [Chlorella variabilis]XP_005852312.1 hypothetical protein CHLNCDRAFT_143371 [Chlorella variabilis]EFN50670.1 hypothetical protein CHLNCDRAFT_143371 [Chlorella variabilis]EFN57976.1 hypothetical protein CHLNCDRAFT_142122 [Chlorella variabilis]|eukprot:XP_005850078.1 hypothetical protein CHLNCDRAFT_142122 [Chlorella variabilis]